MYLSPDFVVIGGGIAGLRAAIALAPVGRVLILTKGEPTESNTGYAQGGIAVALGEDDTPALHAADTIKAGDGLCDEDAVRVLVEQGPPYVRELVEWGTRFDRDAGGNLSRGREAAQRPPRPPCRRRDRPRDCARSGRASARSPLKSPTTRSSPSSWSTAMAAPACVFTISRVSADARATATLAARAAPDRCIGRLSIR